MAANDRKNNFTLLRLVAAILVIVSHSYGACNKGNWQPVIHLGNLTVMPSTTGLIIFFVISGYLVTQSLQVSGSAARYLKNRALRIYPALVVCNILCVLLLGLFFGAMPYGYYLQQRETWSYLAYNTLLVKNQFYLPGVFSSLQPNNDINASLWTLGVELFLYILLLVLWLTGFLKTSSRFIVAAIAVIILCSIAQTTSISTWPLKPYADLSLFFFGGVFLYIYRNTIRFKWYWTPLLLAAILLVSQPLLQSVIIAAFFSYSIIFIATKLPAAPLPLDISYGLYIYAFPVQQCILVLLGKGLHPMLFTLLTLLFTAPVAYLSWKLVEEPALKFKKP